VCLGIPARIVNVKGDRAVVDFGGVTREVDTSLIEVSPGDYVIVHAGIVISKLDREEAEETLKLLEEIVEAIAGREGPGGE